MYDLDAQGTFLTKMGTDTRKVNPDILDYFKNLIIFNQYRISVWDEEKVLEMNIDA